MAPAIIIAILGLATAGTGVAQTVIEKDAAKGNCQKDCKDICKAKHDALFDGRQKCITQCEADCVIKGNVLPPAPAPASIWDQINWWYVGGVVLTVVAIIIYFNRKK